MGKENIPSIYNTILIHSLRNQKLINYSYALKQAPVILQSIFNKYFITKPKEFLHFLIDTDAFNDDLYELGIVIEYQGEQHFRPKTFGGISKEKAQSNFELQQLHDKTKRDYASSHNLILVCPDYKLNSYSKVSKFLEQSLL